MANYVHDWPEKVFVGAFISGLKSEIAADVRVYQPKTYSNHLAATKKGTRVEPRRTDIPPFDGKNAGNKSSGNTSPRTTTFILGRDEKKT